MSRPVICIGAAFVDELFHAKEELMPGTTNEASLTKTAGGVSRNIAHQLALLDVHVQLISVFGNDSDGDWLKQISEEAGVKLDGSITRAGLSGKYTGILKVDGSLFAGFISNESAHLISPAHLEKNEELLKTASYLLADANIGAATGEWLLAFSTQTGIPLILEPVSVPHAKKFRNINWLGLYLVTPNEDELPALCEKGLDTQHQIEELIAKGVHNVWFHNGNIGSAIYNKERAIRLDAPVIEIVDCTGAGDGSLSGFILGKTLSKDDVDCLKLAHTLAAEILQVNGAIATHLNQEKLLALVSKYYPE
ncbi:MAG TPA: PfkB family carbohydrate kinase [Chitinophagaceae bacterium]|nr:PfkB family carbohydrate kinase [Chitinophagaceae bacterium]